MARNSTITVTLKGDNKDLRKAFDDSESRGRDFARNIGRIASQAAAAVVVGGGALAAVSIKQASNLEESANAVRVTFGKEADDIAKMAEAAAKGVGLSASEFNGMAVQFSSFAEDIAGAGGDVSDVVGDISTRAADFASVMNLDVADAARVFQSGLAGETEPLKKFGINLSAAAVEAHAVAAGIINAGDTMTESQKIQARYSLLMAETAKTQGDFANTSDSLANRQRVLAATAKNLAADLGEALLPSLATVATFIAETLVPWLQENLPKAIETVKRAIDGMKPVFEALVEVGSAVVGWFRENWPEIQATIDAVVAWMRDEAWPVVQQILGFIQTEFESLVAWVRENWPEIRETIQNVIDAVRVIVETTIAAIQLAWRTWGDTLVEYTSTAWETMKGLIQAAITIVRGIINTVTALITGDWGQAWEGIKTILSGAWDLIKEIVRGAIKTVQTILQLAWDAIGNYVSDTWDGITGSVANGINDIMVYVAGIPGRVARAIGSGFESIWTSFRSVANRIIDGWNGIEFSMPSIDTKIPGIGRVGGFSVGTPNIPRLHTGGVVPGPIGAEVPIMALAGETVFTREQMAAGAAFKGPLELGDDTIMKLAAAMGRAAAMRDASLAGALTQGRRP